MDHTATASSRSQYCNLTGSDQEIDRSNNSSAILIFQYVMVIAHRPDSLQLNISFENDNCSIANIAINK